MAPIVAKVETAVDAGKSHLYDEDELSSAIRNIKLEDNKEESIKKEETDEVEEAKEDVQKEETSEEEEEEECVAALNLDGDGKADSGHYTSKGPVFRRNEDTNRQANLPYARPVQQQVVPPLPNVDPELDLFNIGQFLEDFDPDLILQHLEMGGNGSPDGEGIPGLPQPKSGVNQILMNSIDDIFGQFGNGSRIILKNLNDPTGFTVLPTPLAISIEAESKRIGVWLPKQVVPANAIPEAVKRNGALLDVYIQLDPKLKRVVKYSAQVGESTDKTGQKCYVIKSQFMALRPFTGPSSVEILLDGVSETDIEEARALIESKDISELLKPYGPNEDSLLMCLCFSKEYTTALRAQVYILTKKILAQTETTHRTNIIRRNKNGLSALEFATITNKPHVSAFLAEVFFDIGEDILCPDPSGNTLLHLMARKGDEVTATMKALLSINLAGSSRRAYSAKVTNNKGQMPIHIAAMSPRCPQNILQLLYQEDSSSLKATTEDGSMPLHIACQFSSDPTLVATLLYYNRHVVNVARLDGFTPLHLIAARAHIDDIKAGIFPIDEDTQVRIIRLLLEHGADRTLLVEKYSPVDLVWKERTKVKLLLKLRRGEGSRHSSPTGSPPSGSPLSVPPCTQFSNHGSPALSSSGFASQPSPYQQALMSPMMRNTPVYSPISDVGQGSVSSGCHESSGSDNDEENASLDAIASVLYNHPTIQAVLDNPNVIG